VVVLVHLHVQWTHLEEGDKVEVDFNPHYHHQKKKEEQKKAQILNRAHTTKMAQTSN
jgi:hypothetical protein